ncbi:MAG: class D beta-lactamase [Pyrinomonadaceae bacterium]|nr:class D beta-lactamase [Pyrinomonadaceae bacterium]
MPRSKPVASRELNSMNLSMMKRVLIIVLTTLMCAHSAAAAGQWEERSDWGKYFSAANVNGSFLLYDLRADKYLGYNLKRARTRYIPASTFKVFNSLVALELGAVKDPEEVLRWDGVDRGIPQWNRDQSMREAIHSSTVWFYQEMARRAGHERMRRLINRGGYGNQNIAGGIDRFWLDGRLRISSVEQIRFLVRLYRNKLPFSRRSMDMVKDILINENMDAHVLRAKTGWVRCFDWLNGCRINEQLGWWVGYVERDGKAYFFAINIDITHEKDAAARTAIAKSILREMKLI